MSTGYLLVSNITSAIRDEDHSRFVVLGEIVWEHIPELRIEPRKLIEPGVWEFELKGDHIEALKYESQGENKAFRVVRENGETCSTEGHYLQLPSPLDVGTFSLMIQAKGERLYL